LTNSFLLERGMRFAEDSPVEGAGFEPSVPLAASEGEVERAQARKTLSLTGTEGSNPPPSTSESAANLTSVFLRDGDLVEVPNPRHPFSARGVGTDRAAKGSGRQRDRRRDQTRASQRSTSARSAQCSSLQSRLSFRW
jgi:hypothetical protein